MIIDEGLYRQISNLTEIDYEGWLNKDTEKVLVTEENIKSMLQDLIWEVEHWKEQYQDLKQDLQENYKPKEINPYEEYGLRESDFH